MDNLEELLVRNNEVFNNFRQYLSLSFYDFYRYQLEDWVKSWTPGYRESDYKALTGIINLIIRKWVELGLVEQMTVVPKNIRLDRYEFCLWNDK